MGGIGDKYLMESLGMHMRHEERKRLEGGRNERDNGKERENMLFLMKTLRGKEIEGKQLFDRIVMFQKNPS